MQFFNPMQNVDRTRANLPHWEQAKSVCFATFRLADSIPQEKLKLWENERDAWVLNHPKPWNDEEELEYATRFGEKIDSWLDAGYGSCVLQNKACREIMENALKYFDGERYTLHAFVVMPNHVHVLFEPKEEITISEILHSWKRFSAKKINELLGTSGALWQKESWDRHIRNQVHFDRTVEYIIKNSPQLVFLGEEVSNLFPKIPPKKFQ